MFVLDVQVAMAEESNGPVTFFDDQMIITSETCILESITPYQRTVPNILSKVLLLIQPIGLYIIIVCSLFFLNNLI